MREQSYDKGRVPALAPLDATVHRKVKPGESPGITTPVDWRNLWLRDIGVGVAGVEIHKLRTLTLGHSRLHIRPDTRPVPEG